MSSATDSAVRSRGSASFQEMGRESSSENRSWLGRQVCRLGQWAEEHPYIAFAIVTVISLVVFGVLLGLGLSGWGLPFVIAAGAGAGGFFLFGNGAVVMARLWQRCYQDANPVSDVEESGENEEAEDIFHDLTLQDFEGENPAQLSEKELRAILRKGPHWHGAAKAVYEVNSHIVLIEAKACQQEKLIEEIERAKRIHDVVVANAEEGAEIFLATHYIPVAGHEGLYLAQRCLGDLDALLKGELEIPEGLEINADLITDREVIRYFKLDFPLALELLGDILTGFEQLHEAGYTHGDIKPENILVRFDAGKGRLVAIVNDFGETRHMETDGDAVLHGDWRYSSPEQRAHQPSDVYGVGLMAMRLLEQARGIDANNAQSIERCFPVQDRGARAFTKTGVARLGGVFGRIMFHPETRIHGHIDGQFSENLPEAEAGTFAPLLTMLRDMTRDLPSTPHHHEDRRCTIQAAARQYREFKQAYDASLAVV